MYFATKGLTMPYTYVEYTTEKNAFDLITAILRECDVFYCTVPTCQHRKADPEISTSARGVIRRTASIR